MKHLAVVLGMAGLLLAGCGKSAEQKHLEGQLWTKVKQLHDDAMGEIMKFGDLEQRIDAAVARHDELATRYPRQMKDHTADDLQAARAELESLREKMDIWMKGFKPYDESLPHEEAMSALSSNLEDLEGMKVSLEKAVAQAEAVLADHQAAAEALMKKVGGR